MTKKRRRHSTGALDAASQCLRKELSLMLSRCSDPGLRHLIALQGVLEQIQRNTFAFRGVVLVQYSLIQRRRRIDARRPRLFYSHAITADSRGRNPLLLWWIHMLNLNRFLIYQRLVFVLSAMTPSLLHRTRCRNCLDVVSVTVRPEIMTSSLWSTCVQHKMSKKVTMLSRLRRHSHSQTKDILSIANVLTSWRSCAPILLGIRRFSPRLTWFRTQNGRGKIRESKRLTTMDNCEFLHQLGSFLAMGATMQV